MSLIKLNQRFPMFTQMFPEVLDSDTFFNEDVDLKNNWMPAINVKENKKDFNIEIAAPGFLKKDFEISISNNVLTIKAKKEHTTKENKEDYARKEFNYNAFVKIFTLPKVIDLDKKINASYENGVLIIHLEKLNVLKNENHKKVIEIN